MDFQFNNYEQPKTKEPKQSRIVVILLCVFFLTVGVIGGRIWQSESDKKQFGGKVADKVNYLETMLEGYYLEDMDYEQVEEYLYKGMVAGLGDPYSEYYTQEEFQQIMESTSGTYYGIGATLQQNPEDGTVKVVDMFKDSPAIKAGMKVDDLIIKVDGKDITGMDLSQMVTYVKGEEGTVVVLTVIRDNKTMDIEVTRGKVEVTTVTATLMDDNIGYIAVKEFDEVSLSQFQKALTDLTKQGMTGLVVDLRNNPGGVLTVVNDILDEILPEGLLVYTEDKYGNRQEYASDDEKQLDIPMVVLVNENSASASEIFAGAMKDYKWATIVGETTFGKGIVQRIVDLKDGSALKVTIAKYYTPLGNDIHGAGVEPDVKVESGAEDVILEVPNPSTDTQLRKGLEILKEIE